MVAVVLLPFAFMIYYWRRGKKSWFGGAMVSTLYVMLGLVVAMNQLLLAIVFAGFLFYLAFSKPIAKTQEPPTP
ncbi:MAG: hypothetical protein Q7S48_04640 [bacterium]|nr:hypothetical protein [bacterium]